MTLYDIESLEYEVASSFKELVELTSLSYAIDILNTFVQDSRLDVLKAEVEDGSSS